MDAIAIDGVVKHYGIRFRRKLVLDAVSLSVPAGSAFGLVGPNGAGKTTLLKILIGAVHADAGTVRLLGRDPAEADARRELGYLSERQALPAAWSALEYLCSVGRLRRVADPRADALQQLKRVGLAKEADSRIGTYSKGMRQRLGLAAALLGSPKLLVLDEPTDGIDPRGRVQVRGILQEEIARGASVLINSHLLSETEKLCDRIGILVKGQLLRSGPLAEVCASADLEDVLVQLMEQADA
jgi:ABC-2 type transport system ATP-binding protein